MISGQPEQDDNKNGQGDEGPDEEASSSSDSDPNGDDNGDDGVPQSDAESKQATQANSHDEEGKAQAPADAVEEEPWCHWGISKVNLIESTCFHSNVVELDLDQERVCSITGMFCHKSGDSWSTLFEFQHWLAVWYFLNL